MKVLDLTNFQKKKKKYGFHNKRDTTEEKISKLEGRSIEILQTEYEGGGGGSEQN